MKISLPWLAAILSVVGFMVWLSSVVPEPPGASSPSPQAPAEPDWVELPAEGSAVPCEVPLSWRIARLDEEFGLGAEMAETLLREAAGLWEAAAGRALFRHDLDEGMPVRFMYDQRQARTDERRRLEAELERSRTTLDPAEFQARLRELASLFPSETGEAGVYREAVTRDGNGVSVSREIRIHRFADPGDLRRVAAHELGHALGLGHVSDSASLMRQSPASEDTGGVSVEVGEDDVERLITLCPELEARPVPEVTGSTGIEHR